MDTKHFDTRAIHAGQHPDPSTGAVMTPIYATSTYRQSAPGVHQGYEYSRTQNPTRFAYEDCIASLESGKRGFAFASGMAAINNVIDLLDAGDHVIAMDDLYGGTFRLFDKVKTRTANLSFSFVDMGNVDNIKDAIQPNTRMIWVETPSNPRLRLSDLAALSTIAKQVNATLLCDNTFATPLNQNPLQFGCDLVLHSTTKYLNGHSDVLGGVLVAREHGALSDRLRSIQICGGAVPSPFDCWLTMRGLATMSLRVQTQCASAEKIAKFLSGHRQIERVHYPSLTSHPQYLLAKAQMRSGGGLLSFEVKGGESAAMAFVAGVRNLHRATSLGGVETLIEHRASMEGPNTRTPRNLVRLAVGVEPTAELIADLDQALANLD